MDKKEQYAVVRMIKQGKDCLVSKDYVEGSLLIDQLLEHPHISRECLFQRIKELSTLAQRVEQMETPGLSVNPYAVVLNGQGHFMLIDPTDSSNEALVRKMQTKTVQALFGREQGAGDVENRGNGHYELGRTIQFIISQSEIEPPLGKTQEKRLEQLVKSLCGERGIDIRKVLHLVPTERQVKTFGQWKAVLAVTAILLMVAAAGKEIFVSDYEAKTVYAEEEERKTAIERMDEMQTEIEEQILGLSQKVENQEATAKEIKECTKSIKKLLEDNEKNQQITQPQQTAGEQQQTGVESQTDSQTESQTDSQTESQTDSQTRETSGQP